MKDIKLILNIQLFAENGASEMQNAECKMQNEGESQVQSAERKTQSEMNEAVESDGLNNEASDENEEVVTEDAEEETEKFGIRNSEIEMNDEDGEALRERENRLRNRISGWLNECNQIKELYPDFDLRNELRSSPLFSRLVLSGAPLQAAYEIVHKDEILSGAMAYTADKVREQVVKNIETKGRRPLENGISSESAVMTAIDVNALTAKDIHKILKQVENGASIKF